jgi:hypothetical protein
MARVALGGLAPLANGIGLSIRTGGVAAGVQFAALSGAVMRRFAARQFAATPGTVAELNRTLKALQF